MTKNNVKNLKKLILFRVSYTNTIHTVTIRFTNVLFLKKNDPNKWKLYKIFFFLYKLWKMLTIPDGPCTKNDEKLFKRIFTREEKYELGMIRITKSSRKVFSVYAISIRASAAEFRELWVIIVRGWGETGGGGGGRSWKYHALDPAVRAPAAVAAGNARFVSIPREHHRRCYIPLRFIYSRYNVHEGAAQDFRVCSHHPHYYKLYVLCPPPPPPPPPPTLFHIS